MLVLTISKAINLSPSSKTQIHSFEATLGAAFRSYLKVSPRATSECTRSQVPPERPDKTQNEHWEVKRVPPVEDTICCEALTTPLRRQETSQASLIRNSLASRSLSLATWRESQKQRPSCRLPLHRLESWHHLPERPAPSSWRSSRKERCWCADHTPGLYLRSG